MNQFRWQLPVQQRMIPTVQSEERQPYTVDREEIHMQKDFGQTSEPAPSVMNDADVTNDNAQTDEILRGKAESVSAQTEHGDTEVFAQEVLEDESATESGAFGGEPTMESGTFGNEQRTEELNEETGAEEDAPQSRNVGLDGEQERFGGKASVIPFAEIKPPRYTAPVPQRQIQASRPIPQSQPQRPTRQVRPTQQQIPNQPQRPMRPMPQYQPQRPFSPIQPQTPTRPQRPFPMANPQSQRPFPMANPQSQRPFPSANPQSQRPFPIANSQPQTPARPISPNPQYPAQPVRPNAAYDENGSAGNLGAFPYGGTGSPADAPQPVFNDTTYEEFLRRYNKSGTLKIQAYAARQAVPLTNVEIVVSRRFEDGVHEFFRGITDVNGVIDDIKLPAPDKNASLKSGNPINYASYDIYARMPGLAAQRYEVQIFDGVETIQPITLRSMAL